MKIRERMTYFLKKLGMEEYKDRVIQSLPLGWKQKLAFSIAVIHEPAIVFLDEPTSGVDPVTRRQFWDMIYEAAHEGITVFLTTHYMDEAEYCERISIMVDGRIEALDTPAALKEQFESESMEEVFVHLARGSKKLAVGS
jgi:ABC-2 type transport system ATP-binding protein